MHQPFLASASVQLNYMTTEELREIFSDDDKLDERINEIVSKISLSNKIKIKENFSLQLKSLENEKDVIISENRSLAESNLEMEPRLIEARSRINELTTEGKELSQNVQEKLQILSESYPKQLNSKVFLHIQKYFRIEIVKRKS